LIVIVDLLKSGRGYGRRLVSGCLIFYFEKRGVHSVYYFLSRGPPFSGGPGKCRRRASETEIDLGAESEGLPDARLFKTLSNGARARSFRVESSPTRRWRCRMMLGSHPDARLFKTLSNGASRRTMTQGAPTLTSATKSGLLSEEVE